MNSYTKKLEEENRLLQQRVIELEKIIEIHRKPSRSEELSKLINDVNFDFSTSSESSEGV
jgi:hypothetical protein